MDARTAIVPGSIADLAGRNGTGIAESILNAEVVILVDVSGSMNTRDARGSQRRYDVACQELARLQQQMPGKIVIVAFSDHAEFVPGGVPPLIGGNTNLAGALEYVQYLDRLMRFIVISDGQPDNEERALVVARRFASTIDVVYVGPEDDAFGGRKFLERLATDARGKFIIADRAHELADKVGRLLLAEVCSEN